MGSAAGADAWLLPAILGFFVIGPGLWIVYRLLARRGPELFRAVAGVERITPFFRKGSPLKTQHVRVTYSFDAGRHRYEGTGILPLRRFVPSVIPPGPVVLFDVRVNMPVLIADETRVIGEEAIEHRLLQGLSQVRVTYVPSDPARNRIADAEESSAAELSASPDPG